MARMSRRRFVALVSGLALVVLGVVVGLVVVLVTQTPYGRDRVRDYIASRIAPNVHGRMYVGKIRGGLLGGVTVDSIEIRDDEDSLVVASGPITLEYDPRDLVDKRVLLTHAKLVRPLFYARKHPDSDQPGWNFERAFGKGKKKGPRGVDRGFGDYIVADSVTIKDGSFILTMPWTPPDTLRGAKLDSAVKAALTSPDHEVRRTKEGYKKTWRWTGLNLESPYVRIADPDSVGRLFMATRMSVKESDPPFLFRNATAAAKVLGDSVWIDVPHFDLPGSYGKAKGKVVWGGGKPIRYAIDVDADSVSMADIAWVYPTMPRTGGGHAKLRIENDPRNLRVLEYKLTQMDVRSVRSHVTGAMTFAVGHPILVVKDVDMVASPMDFELVRTFNGKPFPVDWQGTLWGTVKARGGPLTHFVVDDARLTFRDKHVPGAETRATAHGALDILYPAFTVFKGLTVNVAQGDLRTVQYLYPNFPRLRGTIAGVATLDSSWLDVRFRDADVTYTDGPGDPSRLTGSGRVTWGEVFMTYDVAMEAKPLSLTALAQSYPMLPTRGLVSGPIAVKGTLESLDVTTTLTGAAGTVAFDGHLDAYPPGYTIRGTTRVTELNARALLGRDDVPVTDLTARVESDVTGDSLANLAGRIAADITSGSTVDGLRIFSGRARLRAAEGRMQADTLAVETTAATLFASGGLGLAQGTSDSMRVAVFVDSLGGLRRWITSVPGDSLDGSIAVTATLRGSVGALDATGDLLGRALFYDGLRADSVRGAFAAHDLTHAAHGDITLAAQSMRLGVTATASGIVLDRVEGRLGLAADRTGRATLAARGPDGQRANAGANVRFTGDTVDLAIDELALAIEPREGRNASSWRLGAPATARVAPGYAFISPLRVANGNGGSIALRATLPMAGPADASLVAERVPLSDIASFLESRFTFSGNASARVAVTGTREAPIIDWSTLIERPRTGAVALEHIEGNGRYADRRLDGNLRVAYSGRVALGAEGSLPIDLALVARDRRLLDAPLRATIRADSADLAIIETITSGFDVAAGRVSLTADLGGTWTRPTIDGRLGISGGAGRIVPLGVAIRALSADMEMFGDSLAIRRLTAQSDGPNERGTIALTGWMDLDRLHRGNAEDGIDPRFSLDLTARAFHAMNTRDLGDVHVTVPQLHLAGSVSRSTMTGTVVIDDGVFFIPELSRKRVVDVSDPTYLDAIGGYTGRTVAPDAPSEIVENLALQNVRVVIGPDVWIRSAEANIQLGGEVSVTKARDTRARDVASAPMQLALQGTLTADRGQYRLQLAPRIGRTFDVARGRLTFSGDPDINPALDITALHTVRTENQQDLRVRVNIRGTLAQPELFLVSDEGQQISQTDLVSYLAFGKPGFELVGTGSASFRELGVGTGLLTAGFAAESFLQERFGSAIDVFRVQTGTAGNGVALGAQQQGDLRTTIGTTRVTVGKQVNERTFIGLDAGLCDLAGVNNNGSGDKRSSLFNPQSLGLRVEQRLTHGFSASAAYEPSDAAKRCNLGTLLTQQRPRQWGFDLFRTWSF
ncbi:MAG TPA: translocation/assembly module TamB domain-containing protein [Gemmatimonadaceae bacterium]|nr:translocation/assembly module TamB domain-containing protein [Gemmatimonadaceae bacterium]